jgi:hypothetical protein
LGTTARGDTAEIAPIELHQLSAFRPWWYALAVIALLASALLVVAQIPAAQTGAWLSWVANAFQAVQATLTFFLVVLTYKLFEVASRVTGQNERIHRISQLPIIVAEIEPLSFDPFPSYQIQIFNEGSGPAFDIDVRLYYRLKNDRDEAEAAPPPASHNREVRVLIGVMNKERKSGLVTMDARGIMIGKPWKKLDVGRTGFPSASETIALLEPYALDVFITYKDIYSQVGHTVYQASHAQADVGIELIELAAPSIATGSTIRPIAFVKRDSEVTPSSISAAT